MNKKHWVTISLTGELSQDMLISLAEESYRLVASKLTKKDKAELEKL
jgi:predicted DNA-binding protein (MmcQ/YjbR family)